MTVSNEMVQQFHNNKEIEIVMPMWNFGKAGGVRVLAKLANGFSKAGIRTMVICYCRTEPPYFPIDCEVVYVDKFGNIVEREEPDISTNKLSMCKDLFSRFLGLTMALRRMRQYYNVVFANFNLTAYPAIFSGIANKVYYIQAYEALPGKGICHWLLNCFTRLTYYFPMVRVVNSRLYLNYRDIRSDYVVLPGLDLGNYYSKTKYWDGCSPIKVGCIGRIEKHKGCDDVAKAIEILQNKGFSIEFIVAFNPVSCSQFKLVHPDGDENLADYYRSLDILVATPTYQFGAVHYPVIEAMACGTPVITTGYYPADDTNSYLVPPSCPEKIAEAIEEIYDHYDIAKEKAKVALEDVKQFDWDLICGQFLKIINDNIKE